MNILITGPPGIGKTTILKQIERKIQDQGHAIGGMYCPEIRENGRRTGFNIIDIASGQKGILASIHNTTGPMVGRYKVSLNDIQEIGIYSLENAMETSDYVLIDEIAPMELKSSNFSQTVWRVMESEKLVIAVIHQRSNHPFILKVKSRKDVMIFCLTRENRNNILENIMESLGL